MRSAISRPAGDPRPDDEGFTLIEVMVALLIFVIVSTATVGLLILGLRLVRENTARVQAAGIAQTQLDSLRQRGAALVPVGVSTTAPQGTSTRFTVRTTSQWVGLGQGTASACQAATPGQAYLRVAIDVSSPDLRGPQHVESVIIPEPGQGPGAGITGPTGAVAIAVADQNGQPVSDVVVSGTDTAVPLNAFSVTTGSDGCVYLPAMRVSGSLVVTVAKAGYVASTPTGRTQTVQVSSGGLARVGFSYAASSNVAFTSGVPGFALPGAAPITWQPNATGSVATVVTTATPPTGLWPATSGFSAWMGKCTDNAPSAYGTSAPSFAFTAGGTSNAGIVGSPLILTGITPTLPVLARYAGNDSTCAGSTIDLGRADALGTISTLVPFGTWTIVAGTQSLSTGRLTPTTTVTPLIFTLYSPTASPSASPSGSPSASPTSTP